MATQLTQGFWANEFLRQVENETFNGVQLTRKALTHMMHAEYNSLCNWLDNRTKVSADKMEALICNLPPAAFRFWLDFQAAMRNDPKPSKSMAQEQADVSRARAELDAEYAKAVEGGIDGAERTRLLGKGSVLLAETQELLRAIVA
jgi:hypothetical protein